jgi:hypothetical protein
MKKSLTLLLMILALVGNAIVPAHAEIKTFACGSGTYKVEMPAGILKSSSGCTGEFFIDSSVKEIADSAFYDGYGYGEGTKITSVVIPNSVTSIGSNAFQATGITKLVIPNSVTTIESRAFQNTVSLKSAILSNSLTNMGVKIFEYSGLTNVLIPEGIKLIPESMFSRTQLTSVVIPDSVTLIDKDAFWLSKLESVKFGKSLTKIGWQAFNGNNLVKVDIPDSVAEIWFQAFHGNKNLESIIYCGPDIKNLVTSPTCPADRKAVVDAANAKAAAAKAAADKAAADKAAADKAAADKAAADQAAAYEADLREAAYQAEQEAKKITITCKKGSVTKKIYGLSPKCPKGYVKFVPVPTCTKSEISTFSDVDSEMAGLMFGFHGPEDLFTYIDKAQRATKNKTLLALYLKLESAVEAGGKGSSGKSKEAWKALQSKIENNRC